MWSLEWAGVSFSVPVGGTRTQCAVSLTRGGTAPPRLAQTHKQQWAHPLFAGS